MRRRLSLAIYRVCQLSIDNNVANEESTKDTETDIARLSMKCKQMQFFNAQKQKAERTMRTNRKHLLLIHSEFTIEEKWLKFDDFVENRRVSNHTPKSAPFQAVTIAMHSRYRNQFDCFLIKAMWRRRQRRNNDNRHEHLSIERTRRISKVAACFFFSRALSVSRSSWHKHSTVNQSILTLFFVLSSRSVPFSRFMVFGF